MKKVFFIIVCLLFIPIIKAFDINLEELEINKMDDYLNNSISYKIEALGYEQVSDYNKDIQRITKELVKVSLAHNSDEEKLRSFNDYILYDNENGLNTMSAYIFIKKFVKDLSGVSIDYDYIKIIRTSTTEHGIYSFAYLPNCKVNDETKDVVVVFWLKEKDGEYKLFFPWITYDTDLNNYFNNITLKENDNDNIGGTYNKIGIDSESSIDESKLSQLFSEHKDSNVQITGLNTDQEVYGSGFYLRKGIVVTTWSIAKKLIENNSFVYINDSNGNSYRIEGIVSLNTTYDVALLKVSDEVGKPVALGDSTKLKANDNLYTINSKVNSSFSINYGSFLSINKGKIEKLFVMNSSDIGSALYNDSGEVIGFNTGELLKSDLSYANSTDYLKELKELLDNQAFKNINCVSLEAMKIKTKEITEENKVFSIPNSIWDEFKKIGDIESKISLELLKANYADGIVSLRYKSNISNTIGATYIISNYVNQLVEDGYDVKLYTLNKIVLSNGKYQIIIKMNMDYAIVLMMRL